MALRPARPQAPLLDGLTPVQSSNVRGVGYDEQVLTVQHVDGGVYRYRNVTSAMFADLLAAQSKGRWLARNVRAHPQRFPFEKIYSTGSKDPLID